MQKSFEKRALSSTIANLLLFSTHLIQSILIIPFLLEFWGKEKYGVWLAIYAFFTLIQVFDIGHQTYVGNEFNKYYYLDKKKAHVIISSGIIGCVFIALTELLVTLTIVNLDLGESLIGIPDDFKEPFSIWGSVVLVGMWALAGSVGGMLVRMILPLGLMHRFIYISLIIKLINVILLMLAGFLQWSILQLCIYFAIAYLIYSYSIYFYIYKIMPEFFPWWSGASWDVGWKNFRNSLAITFNSTLEQFSTNGLIMVISKFMGASMIPMFTTLRTVANTALQGTGMILNPLYSDMIRFHTNKEPHKLEQILISNWILTGFLVNVSFLILISFIEPLYTWWTRGELGFDHTLFMLLIEAVAIANYNRGMVIYLSGINHIKAMGTISITRFMLTASISLLGIQIGGLHALGWALVIAEIGCSLWTLWFTQKDLKSIGGFLPFNISLFSALPVVILGLCLWIHAYNIAPVWVNTLLGFITIFLVYLYLLRFISSEVRHLFRNLILNKF